LRSGAINVSSLSLRTFISVQSDILIISKSIDAIYEILMDL